MGSAHQQLEQVNCVIGDRRAGRLSHISSPPGSAGLTTGEAGFLAYYEICDRLLKQNWTKVFDPVQKSNYAFKGEEWVGFDDRFSLSYKVCSSPIC